MTEKANLSSNQQTGNIGEIEESIDEQLEHAILRFNGNILGLVFGIVFGLVIFLATNWLIIKGGPDTGIHLALLNQFFIGYSVTFVGSLIGFLWGFLSGYLIGFIIAWIYNRVILLRKYN